MISLEDATTLLDLWLGMNRVDLPVVQTKETPVGVQFQIGDDLRGFYVLVSDDDLRPSASPFITDLPWNSLQASGFNAAQARVPRGNGRLSGRWIDMPGTILNDLLATYPDGPDQPAVIGAVKEIINRHSDPKHIFDNSIEFHDAATQLRNTGDRRLDAAADKLDDFAAVDWWGNDGEPPELSGPLPHGVASDLAKQAMAGGFTFDTRTMSAPTHGYVVAQREGSSIRPARNRAEAQAQLDAFLSGDQSSPIIGGWYDAEHQEIVLDHVDIIEDRDEAIRLGQEQNQQAIYHLDTGDTIDTGGTGDRPPD